LTGKSIWELIKKNPTAGLYEEKASGKIPVPVETEAEDNSPTGQQATGKNVFFHCGAIYFLFGCTYVIYVTFFVTALVQERGLSEQAAGNLWSWVGLLSLASGPLFGYLSDIYGRKVILAVVFFIQATAYLLAVTQFPMFSVYVSLACFGLVVWSVPTIMAALIGDHASPERTAALFGFVTFFFGIGQIIGPACAGFLAEQSGTFFVGFLLAAILAGTAMVLSLLLPGKKNSHWLERWAERILYFPAALYMQKTFVLENEIY
jgi:MFS family permease